MATVAILILIIRNACINLHMNNNSIISSTSLLPPLEVEELPSDQHWYILRLAVEGLLNNPLFSTGIMQWQLHTCHVTRTGDTHRATMLQLSFRAIW